MTGRNEISDVLRLKIEKSKINSGEPNGNGCLF
jgi:hypothetical protein